MPKVVFDNIVYRDIFRPEYIELQILLLWQTYSFDTAFFIISFYVYFSSKYSFFPKMGVFIGYYRLLQYFQTQYVISLS